jgi:hypothetical protein
LLVLTCWRDTADASDAIVQPVRRTVQPVVRTRVIGDPAAVVGANI